MQREIILVLGQTGSGKTTWAKNYIKRLNRVLILDAGFQEFKLPFHADFESLVSTIDGKAFFRASYSPRQYEMPAMFDLARVLGRCHLVLEECDRLDDPRQFVEYDEAITRGRHYGVSLIGISLYPAKLPAMLRRQATRVICFRQIEPRDLDYLAEIIGPSADELPTLPPFHYIDWTPTRGADISKINLTTEKNNSTIEREDGAAA